MPSKAAQDRMATWTGSRPRNWNSPTLAIHAAKAAPSRALISAAVRPSQSPMANSLSAGKATGVSPWGAARISAVRRVRARSLV
jgi:hypothetical protein